MYFVNLFGIGIRYWNCDIPLTIYTEMDKVRKNLDAKWETLLFDTEFLSSFNISHWQKLSETGERRAFSLTRDNRVEIKQKSKFIDKFKSIDLLGQETLFPKYSTSIKQDHVPLKDGHQRIILVQYETGLFNKYEFNTPSLQLDNLCFTLVDPIPGNTQQWLSGIELNGLLLKSTQNDVLFRGSTVYLF